MRIDWPDGTHRDDLLTKPQGVPDEEWFRSIVADDMPALTACDGQTEKRYRVRIAELEARVTKLEALLLAPPEQIKIPDFLIGPDEVPSELSDLIEYADTPAETNEKLLVRLREVLGLIGLAEDAGGRAAPELYRRKDRLESGIRWNRGRMAETI
jgi:hypothetical protein